MDIELILKIAQIVLVVGGCYVTIKVQIAKLQGDMKSVKNLVDKFLGVDADKLIELLTSMRKEVSRNKLNIHKISKRVSKLEKQ